MALEPLLAKPLDRFIELVGTWTFEVVHGVQLVPFGVESIVQRVSDDSFSLSVESPSLLPGVLQISAPGQSARHKFLASY